MPAYVIAETEVRDTALIERSCVLAAASIAKYGGRYVVRGGKAELIGGAPAPKMLVIVEFPSMARAREWYASPEYAEALEFRATALDRRIISVEGVAG